MTARVDESYEGRFYVKIPQCQTQEQQGTQKIEGGYWLTDEDGPISILDKKTAEIVFKGCFERHN